MTKRFRNGLLSVFIVISLLTSVGLPILGGTSFTSVSSGAQILTEDDNSASATFDDKTKLQGFDITAGKWTTGNLTGWKELDWVPYRLRFRDLPEGTSDYTLNVYHSNLLDGEDGVDKLRDFRVGDEDGNPVTGSVTVSGPFYETSGKECDRDIYYALLVSFTTPSPGLTWCLYWRAHLAFGASKWPGSSLHAYTDISGKKSVPINVPPVPIGSISGYKWNDLNRDGTWGSGEPGLSGWTIQLYSFDPVEDAWIYLADENTDNAGRYTFDELVAGGYRLCEVLKDNWTQTFPPSGCHEVALLEGETRDNINFGNLVVVLAPTVTTNAATGVATTQATMNADFTVGGYDSVDVWFQYRVQGDPTWIETTPTTYTTSGSHSDDATSLSSDTTYEFRAVLQYDTEIIYNNILTFTTLKVIPTATTNAATGITTTQATMNADFTIGDYDSVDVWFQYRVQGDPTWIETTPETCTTSGSHSNDATGLNPNTTHEFRAVLQYDSEKIYGATLTFTTLKVIPTVVTNAATGITTTRATMNADFTVGNYDSVDVWFQYRVQDEDTWIETTPTTCTTSGSHSDDATSLSPNTTYEFRAVMEYDSEKIYGATLTFTTSKIIPTVTTKDATGVATTQATMSADFTVGDYDSVDVWFQYRVQGEDTWIETTPITYTTSGSYSDDATGLNPNTTYEFRACLQYDTEKICSDTLTFTTLKVIPTVVTNAATGITTSQATMNADFTIGDYGNVDVWFQYRVQGEDTWIETTSTTCTTPGSHSDDATSLSPNTTYEFRACLQYDTEKIYGDVLTFTTSKVIPTVTTNAATGITTTQVTMNADFTVGNYDSVDVWFQYRVQGEDTWIETTPETCTASGSHSDDATGLSPNTTCEFRAVLQYDTENIYDTTLTFTTSKVVPTVATNAATGITTTQATLNADFTVGGYDSVDVWFQYRVQGDPTWIETTPTTYTTSGSHSDDATGLSPDTTHEFRACLQYDAEKIYDDPLTFTTKAVQPTSVPTPKSPADGTITNDNTPTFEWTPGENADNHRLLVDNDPDFSSPKENRIVLDNYYTIADENSLPDDNYSWKVIAIDAYGENESSIWTFLIDTIAPAAPTLGSPENNAVENVLTRTFTWTEPEAGATYDIHIDNETSFTSPYVHENTGLADNSYLYTFASDCVYYWRVRAVDAANNQSSWADNFKLTIQAPPGQLTLYLPADGAITNDNTPTFEWTHGENADNHRLLIDDNPDFTSPIENRLFGSTDNTYTLENSLPDDNYSWKVIAINALGENQSPVWTFVIDTVPPGAPSLGSPADGTITGDNTPTFDWPDVEGAENYDFLIDGIQVTISVSTYTLTVELPDGTYSWKVRARDAASNVSEWSSTWTLIIKTIIRGVEVSISPGSKSGAPGETLTYEVTVKNTGSTDDTYTLNAVGAQGWSVSIEPDSLTLAVGATGEATLSVVVPPDASENDSITVTVSAISVGNPAVTCSDTCGTIVKGAVVASGVNLAISLAILAFLIGATILLLAYLMRGRRKRAARRRVLRSVWIGLGGPALAELYLLRGRRRAARRRVLRDASPRPRRLVNMDRDC